MITLDPISRQEDICLRVYDQANGHRLIRRIRHGRSYGGCTTIDVIGCNMLCAYCYTDRSFLIGAGDQLARETKSGQVRPFTPTGLVTECHRISQERNWPIRVQITAGEPFLTPEWLLGVIEFMQPVMSANQEQLWIDTNGINLMEHPALVEQLVRYRSFLRLFVSSKHAPDLYSAMTRACRRYADTGFKCVERLWRNGLVAVLQAPITDLFLPETFPWYLQRLQKIHPAAPLLLDLDRLHYLPLPRIRRGLQSTGLWDRRLPPTQVEKLWRKFLEQHYGRPLQRLFGVDEHPEDELLIKSLVFENRPISDCPLFVH